MIIPWRVDVPEDRLPVVNWLIIAVAVFAFVFQKVSIDRRSRMLSEKMWEYRSSSIEDMIKEYGVEKERLREIEQAADKLKDRFDRPTVQKMIHGDFREQFIKRAILEEYFVWGQVRPFILTGWTLKGFLGHIWLHGGIVHLLGNMLFLWIFGNAVCSKIGNFKYLPIYIGLGLVAGFSQLVIGGQGGLGASGAINGIVGMFLVFFPANEITCYFCMILLLSPYIKEFCISSYWMILFWLVFDIWGAIRGGGHVAYFAHLGGFAGGVILAILMLKFKIVRMERYEKSLLQLIDEYFHPPKEEDKLQYAGYLEMIQHQAEEQTKPAEPGPISLEPLPIPLEPSSIPLEPQHLSPEPTHTRHKDDFIRFVCSCGKRLKMPAKYAGKTGKCPNCNCRLRIPVK